MLLREDGGAGALFTDECVCTGVISQMCGGVIALRVMPPPGCASMYLMQNTLTVVLNGIKE